MPAVDPGWQPERTMLAWRRTSMAMFAGGLLLAKAAAGRSSAPAVVASVLCAVLALVTVFESQWALGHHQTALQAPRPPFLVLVTSSACVCALAAAGVALGFA